MGSTTPGLLHSAPDVRIVSLPFDPGSEGGRTRSSHCFRTPSRAFGAGRRLALWPCFVDTPALPGADQTVCAVLRVQVEHLFEPTQPVLERVAVNEPGGPCGVVATPALGVRSQRPNQMGAVCRLGLDERISPF